MKDIKKFILESYNSNVEKFKKYLNTKINLILKCMDVAERIAQKS